MTAIADGPHPIVRAQELTKRFGDYVAVDRISFEIRPGEVLGFLGPNGAGKTTTIRMLTCLSPLSSGSLTVFGLDVARHGREIKAQIGVVPQENNHDPDLNALDNLMTYCRYFSLDPRTARERALELLEFVQLKDKLNAPVEELSGGMKRRLILARSLVNRPRLLVLDEPTTGLDPQGRRLIWERIRELRTQGVTVILTTHYMDEAEQVCDRLLIMDSARIIAEGTPAELLARHAGSQVLEIVPERSDDPLLAEVLSACSHYQRIGDKYELFAQDCPDALESVRARLRLSSYSVRRATLEDVFIRLTGRELRD
jgi:lipooligosaccharide transport system ATP-binding protein